MKNTNIPVPARHEGSARRACAAAGRKLGLSLLPLVLAGCQGMYLHNPDRAAVAATAKASIGKVDVAAVTKTEQDNLAKLLAEEITTIDARSKLAANLALIEMSASDNSVASHYRKSMAKVKGTFAKDSMLALKEVQDCGIRRAGDMAQLANLREQLQEYGATDIPFSLAELPEQPAVPPGLSGNLAKRFTDAYKLYRDRLNGLRTCANMGPGNDLARAKTAYLERQEMAARQKAAVDNARKAYAQAVAANAAKTASAEATAANIQKKADELLKALDKLADVSPSMANRIKGEAVVELLSAAVSGDTTTDDPSLAPALELAKGLPSLAQSIRVAKAAREQVPVSHLLLSLNHLVIAAARDDRLAALDAEEVAILEQKAALLEAQAGLWRTYSDNLCNLAMIAAGKGHPGTACDTIQFEGKDQTCVVTFNVQGKLTPTRIDACVLGRSWRSLFEDASLGTPARRALNEAAAGYLQVRLSAYSGTAQEFRRLDVAQRRSVVRNEAALQQWKNVVAVPAAELDGYYAGGAKPAEIADLIVKALGFTAIAIGAAK